MPTCLQHCIAFSASTKQAPASAALLLQLLLLLLLP